jgi:hypothetical protein
MRNLAFVIWLLGWPALIQHSHCCASNGALAAAMIEVLAMFVWGFVAWLVFEGKA